MAEEPAPATERWLCLGRRQRADGTGLATAWRSLTDGQERLYLKLTGVVGGEYDITVSHSGDRTSVHGQPVYAGQADDVDPAQVGAWKAADQAAYAADRARLLEASARRRNELDEALRPVLEIAARLTSFGDRDALARYVTAKIYAARRAKD